MAREDESKEICWLSSRLYNFFKKSIFKPCTSILLFWFGQTEKTSTFVLA